MGEGLAMVAATVLAATVAVVVAMSVATVIGAAHRDGKGRQCQVRWQWRFRIVAQQ